jgi:hypothetical protein
MIDKQKLNVAFALMRQAGLIARQNFSCCGSCAGYDIAQHVTKMPAKKRAKVTGVCTYNRQDAVRLDRGGDLHLGFGSVNTQAHGSVGLPTAQVGRLVTLCLAQAGLSYEWDGEASRRILVRSDA